jgi:hypothetical protein
VFFAFIPHIRPQKDLRLPADLGDLAASAFLTGGLRFIPCALAEARPFAFRPPLGFLPSALCHAGDFAIYLAGLPIAPVWIDSYVQYFIAASYCLSGDGYFVISSCSFPLLLLPHLLSLLLHSRVLHHCSIRHSVHTFFSNRLLASLLAIHIHHCYSLKVIVVESKALPASWESFTAASISFCFVELGSIP